MAKYPAILISAFLTLFLTGTSVVSAQSLSFNQSDLGQFMEGKYLFHDTLAAENNGTFLRFGPIPMFSLPSVFSISFDSTQKAIMGVWVYKGPTTVPDVMVDGKERASATIAQFNAIKKKIESIHGEATMDNDKKSKTAVWNYSNSSMALTYEEKGIGLVIMHTDADHAPLSPKDFQLDYKFITETK